MAVLRQSRGPPLEHASWTLDFGAIGQSLRLELERRLLLQEQSAP